MSVWGIEQGVIVFHDGSEVYMPNANEIFASNEDGVFSFGNKQYPTAKESLPIRFSKFGAMVELHIEYVNENIVLNLFAIKSNEKYVVSKDNGAFVDYIIAANAWHYLDGDYQRISEAVSELGIDVSRALSYVEYMELVRNLKERNIVFLDEVFESVENIKENDTLFHVPGLQAKLFPYQERGCAWLSLMYNNGCGCILGDEMGLGKTLQIIALMGKVITKNPNAKFLVVAPISLLENWRREIEKFYPTLKTLIHHGSRRTGAYYRLLEYDVVIMSYSNVQTDLSMLEMITWDLLVLDEAQNIKNPYAARTKNVKQIKKKVAIAVTGTPFENHMTDIWSLVDFVIPGYLGTLGNYERNYKDDVDSAAKIEGLITPILLRRLVKNVATDLPERVDIPQPILMTTDEAALYESNRNSGDLTALSQITIDKIQELRIFCTHPLVYDSSLPNKDPIQTSNKYARLCEILYDVVASGEKAIIFTSFNKMVDILCTDIPKRFGVRTWYINGSVPPDERQGIIDAFSEQKGAAVLVLNPRAAGTGLNITAANHVIHYNLEWNPALEDQASARAYRRGQKKTVFVHRLFYSNTIEEVINDRIQRKRAMSDLAIVGNIGEDDKADLIRALNMSPIGG